MILQVHLSKAKLRVLYGLGFLAWDLGLGLGSRVNETA